MRGNFQFGQQWVFPRATVTLESPGLLISQPTTQGVLDGETAEGVYDILVKVMTANPDFYWLMGLGALSGFSPEARSRSVNLPDFHYRGLVAFGGSFKVRAWTSLLLRAQTLVKKIHAEVSAVVKDEAEARAWVIADRARREKQLKSFD